MTDAIAIVGMACQYPDAHSPLELWENVLAQRRAFRQLPPERFNLADYLSADQSTPDCTYATQAALIEGYEFDRVGFRVAGSTFRSADLVHWLALDVAAQALADAGFPDGKNLPRERTGVLLGNTLTGEFSRANTIRLRWPYVRRVVEATLIKEGGFSPEQCCTFLKRLESQYKAPFPEIGAETLAGNLSNTIAGRICNHFDLKGGGYTLDGACSSSLLAISSAASALVTGDLEVALAGGVDLSLDPFELVGFAKAGALATEEMRVYDARSAGFWPGEGCGVVVLMRYEDAVAQHHRIYAVIRGWGISSDGSGGITRPEVAGQLLALHYAYRRAGFGIESVGYFEGHGTGTSVGDTTELQALSGARRAADFDAAPAAIGSIKANIGHTKAAAGVAGLIKAVMALHTQILPPTTGCEQPHSELMGKKPALKVLKQGQLWPADLSLRAGVSAMGFGGINTHLVLEGTATERRSTLSPQESALLSSAQDAELILIGTQDIEELRQQVEHLLELAPRLSRAEVADLSAQLARNLGERMQVRAALVAATPQELTTRLETLHSWLTQGVTDQLNIRQGVFLGTGHHLPRIAFLFPGQGSPTYLDGNVWSRRFEWVRQLYAQTPFPTVSHHRTTAVAQPAIVTASVAGLRTLAQLNIVANIAVGHSLGELTALHWAGGMDEAALLRIATVRGKAMAELGTGAMASIRAAEQQVRALLNGKVVVIAGLNSPNQTVISGETSGVSDVLARAQAQGLKAMNLPVSHAFHSPLIAAAAQPLAEQLVREEFQPLHSTVVSTVTGSVISADEDLRTLLIRQVTAPVRFIEAATQAGVGIDLLIEVGPGRVLSTLVSELVNAPAVALDSGGDSLIGLLQAVGAAFALGAPIHHHALFEGRFTRPLNLDWQPRFFVNPCELAPQSANSELPLKQFQPTVDRTSPQVSPTEPTPSLDSDIQRDSVLHEWSDPVSPTVPPPDSRPNLPSPLDLVRQLVAERAELPPSAVQNHSRLLSDLHLNSITVGQLVAEAARSLNLSPPVAPTHYANATVAEVAQALETLSHTGGSTAEGERLPSGVDSWLRTFTVELVEKPISHPQLPVNIQGDWQVFAPADHPLAKPLIVAFKDCTGGGVVVCLPPEPSEEQIDLLLAAARTVLTQQEPHRFVLVQHGGGGAAFARTLHLEIPITTCVVDVPVNHPQASEWVLTEALSAVGYSEAHYDSSGKRFEPRLRLLPLPVETQLGMPLPELPLSSNDTLLVIGGGKGIAAECALSLAKETGVRLILLGRSNPERDAELSGNLERMTTAGIQVRYLSADVTDAVAVQKALRQVEEFGPITAILHGAGVNIPKLIPNLDKTDFLCTIAPKVQGLRNVLAAVNPEQLKLLITFGSIIARTGLPGEADYALANEWLTHLVERFQKEHPSCRCFTLEWSIWSGMGMGERLGRVDALMQQGITPISPDAGISILRHLLTQLLPVTSIVVTGRFGEPPTLKVEERELPFLRFLERKRVDYPAVELVVDVELSPDTDPYLNDHVFQGERLFPAVMGLEAMAEVAMALAGSSVPPIFEAVKFNRPVVIPDSPITLRLAALVRDGDIQVTLRSQQTDFQVDHFQATCCFDPQSKSKPVAGNPQLFGQPIHKLIGNHSNHFPHQGNVISLSLNPEQDLYDHILFQKGRFRRLRGYQQLRATECLAEIAPDSETQWFSRYLPGELVLGDPAVRDAAIHALQACIPHATILPIGVDRLIPYSAEASGSRFVYAQERMQLRDTFIYDLEILRADGVVLERWEGLRLQVVQPGMSHNTWVEPLLGPYVERRIRELIPSAEVRVVVDKDPTVERRVRSDRAIKQALGSAEFVWRRPDGKPEVAGGQAVSAAHAGDVTLAVAGSDPVSCDLEPVLPRSAEQWQDLLGKERFSLAEKVAQEVGENQQTAATRIWAASECLQKAGFMVNAPLVLVSSTPDSWVVLASGQLKLATFAASLREAESRFVLAVLVRG